MYMYMYTGTCISHCSFDVSQRNFSVTYMYMYMYINRCGTAGIHVHVHVPSVQ